MVAVGWSEILILILLGGTTPADVVSMLHADDYFQSRKIDLTVEKMLELAGKDPVDGKAQIQQLLALRTLGDDPSEVKKSGQQQAVMQLLQQIADGKKAQDPLGFARTYASRTLARLEGKTPPAPALPKDSLRSEAFKWFPAAATLIGGADFRGGGDDAFDPLAPMRKLLTTKVPPEEKAKIYEVVEALGNIRIDRSSFAFVDEPQAETRGRIFIRVTGKGDPKRILDVLEQKGGFQITKKDGVTLAQHANRPPLLAFIGDSDVLFVGANNRNLDHGKLVDEVLAIRARGEGSVLSGKFNEELQKLAADGNGIIIGQIPADFQHELTRGGVLPAAPESISAVMKRGKALQVKFQAVMTNADDAKDFSTTLLGLRDKGVALLQNVPPQAAVPARVVDNFRKTLESLKLNADGKTAQGSAEVDGNIGEMLQYLIMAESRSSTVAPPPVIKKQ